MNSHGAVKSVAPIRISNIKGRSEYEVIKYYQQKLGQLTELEKYQLLNNVDEQSRYILFQVMNYRP